MSLDLTKPVRTKDGRAVRILCTDREHPTQKIVGLISEPDGEEWAVTFNSDGCYFSKGTPTHHDLVNVPDKVSGWMNVYPQNHTSNLHETREEADRGAIKSRIACIYVEAEEGQGL